jgi:FlaA1/EpsC-like NDP-sugar epimerase
MLIAIDFLSVMLASFLALYIRYDFKFMEIDKRFMDSAYIFTMINTLIIVFIYFIFKLYASIWKFASIEELIKIIEAEIVVFAVIILEMVCFGFKVPRSYPFMFVTILMAITIVARFGYRFLRRFRREVDTKDGMRTMIIGGGQAAALLLKEIRMSAYY